MMSSFSPFLDVLPPEQCSLWPKLSRAKSLGFVLYGGTGIALQLGHRVSVDFDFFSSNHLDKSALTEAFPFVSKATRLQDGPNTLTLLVEENVLGVVKVFFSAISNMGELDAQSNLRMVFFRWHLLMT